MSVRQAYQELRTDLRAAQASLGPRVDAPIHCRSVTASYWPGLFACYDVPDLPRTNNATWSTPSARRALWNAARPDATAPRRPWSCAGPSAWWRQWRPASRRQMHHWTRQPWLALRPQDLAAWKQQRRQVEERHATRRAQARFRRGPAAYLTGLENTLLKPALPP